jgi:molybdate transport system regulatory protein
MELNNAPSQLKIITSLVHNDEVVINYDMIQMLDMILNTGSIMSAGKQMNMSYRSAWGLVDFMNRCFSKPLVKTVIGGNKGGGATLTPMGMQVLDNYNKMNQVINNAAKLNLSLFSDLILQDEKKIALPDRLKKSD